MQLCVFVVFLCVCLRRKGGGAGGFKGRAPVWDICCMECWERTKQMGELSAAAAVLGDCQQAPCYSTTPHPPLHPPSPHRRLAPSLSRLQAQKRGAILRDQNEAGTDNLV